MKRKLTYRDQLIELAEIYGIKEVQDYLRNKKNLTTGQLELILQKNKVVIPKDFKTDFFKENFIKPFSRVSKGVGNFKESFFKGVSKFPRKVSFVREDVSTIFSNSLVKFWKTLGNIGLGFLNVLPKLGSTVYNFIGKTSTDLFNSIYNQKLRLNKVNQSVVGFFLIAGIIVIVISGFKTFYDFKKLDQKNVVEKEIKKPETISKKEVKKIDPKDKNKSLKSKELAKKPNLTKQQKKEKITEVILPDLNLKTATVLNLFKDVNYDLNKVRFEKKVKPIYFTQFPKDLDEIQSMKLKKETFIKIVLPLIVAENEKILDDRFKLKKITSRKNTSDEEKQWLRQKFLEYKVKKGSVEELKKRMDIIPASIALAQAAKESGWGTSRFALEGNAIFGQWTWDGKGIAPLMRDKSKNHKILRFPILRASVKSYKKNLNTHKSYEKFREKRLEMREKKVALKGLDLTSTLDNYAETGSEYTKKLEELINQNKLSDFEPVRLANSTPKAFEL